MKVFGKGVAKNWYLHCRIRKSDKVFRPEGVVRQRVTDWLIDDLGHDEDRLGVEVGVQAPWRFAA